MELKNVGVGCATMNSPLDNFGFEPDEFETSSEAVKKAKSKLIMDFGLEKPKLEHINLEVLKQLIRERPDRMSQIIRGWLHPEDSGRPRK